MGNSRSTRSEVPPSSYLNEIKTRGECLKDPTTFLNEVLKNKIKIDPKEEKQSVQIVTDFLDKLTKKLKETDELFNFLFQRIYYTGSYYDDLRVSRATEFDINLVLKFPLAGHQRTIECSSTGESFAKYRLNEPDPCSDPNLAPHKKKLHSLIKNKFVQDNYLMPSKILNWVQSIIDMSSVTTTLDVINVSYIGKSSSGPAKTMQLKTKYGYNIDIDLVPVIEICPPEWPTVADKSVLTAFKVLEKRQKNRKPKPKTQAQKEKKVNVEHLKNQSKCSTETSAKKEENKSSMKKAETHQLPSEAQVFMNRQRLHNDGVGEEGPSCSYESAGLEMPRKPARPKKSKKHKQRNKPKLPKNYVQKALDVSDQFWFLVPKKFENKKNVSPEEAERFWRIHFPEIERKLLYNRDYAKSVIKLLKLLRDAERWDNIASYYLKTVVMWMVIEHQDDLSYWKQENVWLRLKEALEELRMYVEKMRIPYLYCPSHNLLEKMSPLQAENLASRLGKIIQVLEGSLLHY